RARRQGRRHGRGRRHRPAAGNRGQQAITPMQYNVLATDARQQVVALTLEAENETFAANQARAKGLSVLSVEAKGFRLGLPRRSTRFPVMLFSAELVSLLDAGLNLVEALTTLAEKERRAEGQEVLSAILAAIRRGAAAAFLDALRRHHQGGGAQRQRARGARPLHQLPGRDRSGEEEDRLGQHLPGDPDDGGRAGDVVPHVLRGAALRQ